MKPFRSYPLFVCLMLAACGAPSDGDLPPAESSGRTPGNPAAADSLGVSRAGLLGTCASGMHKCPAWGATCSGNTLQTCVLDADGCRTLMTHVCKLGCDAVAGECKTCSALSVPKRSASLSTPTSFYGSVVRKGDIAIASWQQRMDEYSLSTVGIAAVDLSKPDALAVLGSTALPPNYQATSLQLVGNRLYGLVYDHLQIWDATDPSKLLALGSYVPADAPESLAVASGVAYVGSRSGIEVVDVKPVAGPKLLSVYSSTVPAYALAVANKRVALTGNSGVEVIDAADPTALVLLGKATLPSTVYSFSTSPLAFDGTRAYVLANYSYGSTGWMAVHVAELTPAHDLVLRGSLTGLDSATSLFLSGGSLVVQLRDAVGTVDVSDPATPRWKKYAWLGGGFKSVAANASMLYSSGIDGLTAVDLTRTSDVNLQPATGAGWLNSVVTKGSIAYLSRATGMVIEDVRDPVKPVVLSTTPMKSTDLALDGTLAYVSVYGEGLRIYDISSPWKPALVGQVATSDIFGQVSVSGGRAYAICGIGALCVYDVSRPALPTLITKSDVLSKTVGWSSVWSVFAMSGSRLYATSVDHLYIVDMSTPTAPKTLGSLGLGGDASGYGSGGDGHIALSGGYAVIVYDCHLEPGDHCFEVIDVSNPSLPKKVGAAKRNLTQRTEMYKILDASSQLSAMNIASHFLFLSNGWGGVFVMDLANPTKPQPLGDLWTPLPARTSFLSERFLTTFTESSFPFPAPPDQRDQVIQLCN